MTIYKPKKLKEAEKLKSVSLEVDKRETVRNFWLNIFS